MSENIKEIQHHKRPPVFSALIDDDLAMREVKRKYGIPYSRIISDALVWYLRHKGWMEGFSDIRGRASARQLVVTADESIIDMLKTISNNTGVPMTRLYRAAIKRYLKDEGWMEKFRA